MNNQYLMAINDAILHGSGQLMIDCNGNVNNVDYKDIYRQRFNERVARMNQKDYQYKPRFMHARQLKRMMKEMDQKWSNWQKDIDFKMF